ncbi:Heat-labile enterotoxin IIA, A chain [Ophiocordyceps camponoti-floridani]|uniref:Heat-labile enterotoxin IIA, A chain n=1 Tax=Ophiocordyceps camponoti-floridani TaxID=2030778 RepID=A0A8H4VBR5_9HYPO|nr:Heat-labile enterotoxin IIA, A chain [Ophiocordyceps camponoti-floridani]
MGESSNCVITKRDGSCSLGSVSKEDMYNVRFRARVGKSVLLGQLAPYAHYALQSLKKWANPIGKAVGWVDDAITEFQEAIGGKQVPMIHGNELKLTLICSLRPSNPRWPNILDRKCAEGRERDRWNSLTQEQRDKETREKEEAQKREKEAEMVLGVNKVLEACDRLIDGPPGEVPDGAAQNCKGLRDKVLELQGLGTVDMGTFAGCKCVYPLFEPVGSHCGDVCRVRLANRGLDAEEIKATANRREEKPEANRMSDSIVEVTLEACDGAEFQGTCRNMTYTHKRCENLPTELNSTISSMRFTTDQTMERGETVCRLFRDPDCQGRPVRVMKHMTMGNMSTYSGYGHGPDNQISSIKCLLSSVPQGLLAPVTKTRLPQNAKRHIWIPNNLKCSRWILVKPDEGCAEIAARADVSLARIRRWNAPGLDLCHSFVPGSYACVSTIQADGTMARDLPEFQGLGQEEV